LPPAAARAGGSRDGQGLSLCHILADTSLPPNSSAASEKATPGACLAAETGLTAEGLRVEGKRYRAAGVSLGEVFGISGAREEAGTTKVMRMLRPEELAHALAGRRIDGTAIQLPSQKRPDRMTKKELAIVAGAQKRLRTALGLPAEGDPTQEHLQNIAARKMGNGERLDLDTYRRAITGDGARIGFVDARTDCTQ
jgi:hypothetical protein